MVQSVKKPTARAWVAAKAQVQSWAQELPYAVGAAIKKKTKKKPKPLILSDDL